MTDLWGELEVAPIKTPVSILREQGSLLEQKTKGVLTVSIPSSQQASGNEARFVHSFSIRVPSLNYTYLLFSITHKITLYPVTFIGAPEILEGKSSKIAKDEQEFLKILGQILKSQKTQSILNALLSQSAVT
ncbi:MAG: hypothetical protein M3033_13650 [Acidobacteriota bacterium]|nr:hypothetical protein [Acidobacteriota bacterium]